jgi:PD-(D/E)XK endonuclease
MNGNRIWTSEELSILKLMRTHGLPFSLISQTLNRSEQAIIVKASKLKIQAPRIAGIDDELLVENQDNFLTLDSKLIGSITEEQVKIKLALCGYEIYTPYMNNHKTDVAIVMKSNICRIQVKSEVYDRENKRFRSQLRTKDSEGRHIGYASSDVDFFIVKCNGLDDFYVVPYEIGNSQHNLNLYPHRLKMRVAGIDFEPYRNAFYLIKEFFEIKI